MLLGLISIAAAQDLQDAFVIGSYGRAQASTDLAGGRGESANLVAWGPRLEADPYAELDVGFHRAVDTATFRVLFTPAVSGDPFHYTGQWNADLAVRNLYGMATFEGPGPEWTVWAGSRMYRGDDVYLLNFWPLDNLNTVGGGAGAAFKGLEVRGHVGVNRLETQDWQVQRWSRPQPGGVGTDEIVILDRQRQIASLQAVGHLPVGPLVLRAKLHGERHRLPEGQRLIDDRFLEELPADRGMVLGAQLSAWPEAGGWYGHVFYRYSTGLAAYGELSIPSSGLATDYTVASARQHVVAVSAGQDTRWVSWILGGYVRSFTDADGQTIDVDDRNELALSVRPEVHLAPFFSLGFEASHQWLRPNGLNPRTGTFDVPQVTKLSVLPMLKPQGTSYSRPMIHLTYTMSVLNDDALAWFDPQDQRAQASRQHFVGVGVEWWINSLSYTAAQ